MATLQKTPPEVAKCRHLLQGLAKNLADRLYGPDGPPPGTSFSRIEAAVLALESALGAAILTLFLERQAETFHRALPAELRLCPSCHGETIPRPSVRRELHTRSGVVTWQEPQRYCWTCRKAYFPQSKALGLDLGSYSPSVLDLICHAGANTPSFREASRNLGKMAELAVGEKQVERVSKAIGLERVAERDREVAAFMARPLVERCDKAPKGVEPPGAGAVAVVMADAGMLQLRDRTEAVGSEPAADSQPAMASEPAAGGEPARVAGRGEREALEQENEEGEKDDVDERPRGRHWHENKVGLVLTMGSSVRASDPYPDIPDTFLNQNQVVKIIKGLKKSAGRRGQEEEDEDEGDKDETPETTEAAVAPPGPREQVNPAAATTAAAADGPAKPQVGPAPETTAATADAPSGPQEPLGKAAEARAAADGTAKPQEAKKPGYEGPKLEKRRVVASRQSWPAFGVILAAAAWAAGLAPAVRKAFVADGARAIWRVWKARFSSYVPILDFIHVLSYVYGAAQAVGTDQGSGWELYVAWIKWVWQGQVGKVIECLKVWQGQHGLPDKGEAATSVRRVVAKVLGYLRNNEGKMKYAEYRQQGLPLMSSLVESMVKQIGRRVKGTEKFWGEEGAEALLQLRADYLSDGEVMAGFWQRRQEGAMGHRPYRKRKKTRAARTAK